MDQVCLRQDPRHAHRPFVCTGSDGTDGMLHGKKDIARARKEVSARQTAWPELGL